MGALERLQERYGEEHCPHELGLFLGIPLEDVIAFQKGEQGTDYLLNGYWKVYSQVEKAKYIFRQYDLAKVTMMTSLLKGLRDIS